MPNKLLCDYLRLDILNLHYNKISCTFLHTNDFRALDELGVYFIHNDNIYGVVFNSVIEKSNLTLTEFLSKADSAYDKLMINVPTADWADRVLFLEEELAPKLSIRLTGVDCGIIGYYSREVAKDAQFILKHEFGVDSEVVGSTLSLIATDKLLDFLQSHNPLLLD